MKIQKFLTALYKTSPWIPGARDLCIPALLLIAG